MERKTIQNILNFLKEKEGKQLPYMWVRNLTQGELIQELETHPDGTQYRYNDSLDLNETNIKKLPNKLYVSSYLDLGNCKQLIKLPDNLYVGGELYLKGCTQLTKLPDNLYVGDSLNIKETSIEEIPNNLYIGWNLYITNTPLANKYTDEEIRDIVKLPMDDGTKGKIFR
jgi:hypothetical protein